MSDKALTIGEVFLYNLNQNEWKESLEKLIEERENKLKQFNSVNITPESFKSLPYNEAKAIFDSIKWNLKYELREAVEKTLEEMKRVAFPIMQKAHYYPIVNGLQKLTDKQKHQIDLMLYDQSRSYIEEDSRCWRGLDFDSKKRKYVLAYLHQNNILKKEYVIMCGDEHDRGCSEECEWISEKKYNNTVKKNKILAKGGKSITKEEWEWLDKLDESGEYLRSICCMECDGFVETDEINIEDLLVAVRYKIVVRPDMTYANK